MIVFSVGLDLACRLFEGAGQGLDSLKASVRKSKPPLKDMLSQVIEQLDPDEAIEEQYKVSAFSPSMSK